MSDEVLDVIKNLSDPQVVAPPAGGESPEATPAAADTAVREEGSEEQPKEAEPKRDRRAEKRISKLTQQKEAALREAGYWKGMAEARASQPAPQPTEPARPTQAQFTSYEDFVEALTDWKLDQKLKARPTAPRQTAATQEDPDYEERRQTILDRITEAGKDIEDFDEVIEKLTDGRQVTISPTMRDYFGEADHPAQLAQWLTENPGESRRIAGMTEGLAVKAMEKADARFGKKAAPTTSRASAPPPVVSGGGGAAPNSVERMSHADLLKWTARQSRG